MILCTYYFTGKKVSLYFTKSDEFEQLLQSNLDPFDNFLLDDDDDRSPYFLALIWLIACFV